MTTAAEGDLAAAVSAFGRSCKRQLAGPGDREAAIRGPLQTLMTAAGLAIGLRAVFHDEVRDVDRRVRPDYGVAVGGAVSGYLEVKAPDSSLEPESFTGHNRRQWQRLRDVPNLLYTNGTQWRHYRSGELVDAPVGFAGGRLTTAGTSLAAPPTYELMLRDFLGWRPDPLTTVGALVAAVAPLTRLLRGEVVDQLAAERAAIRNGASAHEQRFLGMARDWRALLFPSATDGEFADGYAQTVTFALLLARTNDIPLVGVGLHDVGRQLGDEHSLMGRALQLLTDDVAADFRVTLDLLTRVVGAVDWPRARAGRRDTYLHLYESFLERYDPDLRRASGSYYTPHQVVDEMVRLAEDVLVTRLRRPSGFADRDVHTVDPAMGTGTYLQTVIERVRQRSARFGSTVAGDEVSALARRLYGFEVQTGPFAVAQLRIGDLLAETGAEVPDGGLRLYVTDTLDDHTVAETGLSWSLEQIARSRRAANEVKARTHVTVVIGNPPYRERAEGEGGWVESGSEHAGRLPRALDDFRAAGNGLAEYVLKNLYVYF